jgi:hypothetical protein
MYLNEDKGLAPLFYGLCLFWGIPVEAADPDDPSDFCLLPGRERSVSRDLVYVVLLPEPAARQVEIQALLYHGNQVLILDEFDMSELRLAQHVHQASGILRHWISSGETHAGQDRRRLGIAQNT